MARRSKYKFASLEVGSLLTVAPIDVFSMRNSLAGFNRRNGTTIEISDIGEPNKDGNYEFYRTK